MGNVTRIQLNQNRQIIDPVAPSDSLRIDNPAEAPTDQPSYGPQIRSGGEARRIVPGQGDMQVMRQSFYNSGDGSTDVTAKGGNIVHTGRSQSGRAKAAQELTLDDIVTVDGMEMSVRSAMSVGALRIDHERGGFRDLRSSERASTSETRTPALQPHHPREPDPGLPEPLGNVGAEEFLGDAYNRMPREHLMRVMDDAAANDGELSPESVSLFATQLGIGQATARARMTQVVGAFRQSASRAMAKAGLANREAQAEFLAFTRDNDPDALTAATRNLYRGGNSAALTKLAQSYVQNLHKHNPAAVMDIASNSGVPVRKSDSGDIVLTLPGIGEVDWSTAVHMGLLGFKG